VYAPIPNEVGRAEMHQFAIELVGSTLQFVERSSLGSKPKVRTLYDFSKEEGNAVTGISD
jgi:hypothetical protein